MSDYYIFTDFETNGLKITETDVPIEIGMLLTDDTYSILNTFSCYINPFDTLKNGWDEHEMQAHRVHTIPFNTIKNEGLPPAEVVEKIQKFLYTQKDTGNSRLIIMSDNSQFEYNSMKMLYKLANKSDSFPFHHSAWDINILVSSVEKVNKGRSTHKAIQDAFRSYKVVIRALERTGFKKWEK